MQLSGRILNVLVASLLCLIMQQPASAKTVTGSFAGLAFDMQFGAGDPPPALFNGASVKGTFSLVTDLVGLPESLETNFASYRLVEGALMLSFSTMGATYVFGNEGLDSAATVYTDASGQNVLFGANFFGSSGYEAMLSFGGNLANGATGLYVDGLDLTTFHPGPVQLAFTDAYFRLAPTIGARVLLSDLQFNAVNAVPEVETWALLVAGLGVVGWRWARYCGRA